MKEKTKMITFLIIAYGITYLMGIFMWYGNRKGYDLSVFPSAQMLYPAAGVALGVLLTNKGEKKIPKGFFITLLVTTLILILLSLASVAAPMENLVVQGTSVSVYNLVSQYVLIIGSIVFWIFLIAAGKEKRKEAGLFWKNGKASAVVVILFVFLYFLRTLFSGLLSGLLSGTGVQYVTEWLQIFNEPILWISVVALPINFFFVVIAFFGEEYGWRYYLQPLLQKKFGLRWGVIILGVVWGLWHVPIDLFYYTQTSGIQMIFAQQITCITLGIFFAYAYMKTENIWVPVCLHYLNNNLIPIFTATFSGDVLENQVVSWGDLPLSLLINGICFGFFLLSDVFKRRVDILEKM